MTPQDSPNARSPEPGASPPTSSGGSSVLKTIIPLLVLVAVVFGIAYLAQDAPRDPDATTAKGNPLHFFTHERQLETSHNDPTRPAVTSPNLLFPGFFEPDQKTQTSFWFENTTDRPAIIQPVWVSCSACSEASLVMLPPDATRDVLQMIAVGGLPNGPATGLNQLAVSGPVAVMFDRARESQQAHEFKTRDWAFTVPGAIPNADGWSPHWGILTLHFTPGQKTEIETRFSIRPEGAKEGTEQKFKILYTPVPPFAVEPRELKLPRLDAAAEPYTADFIILSPTRGFPRPLGQDSPDRVLAEPAITVDFPPTSGTDPDRLLLIAESVYGLASLYLPAGQLRMGRFVTIRPGVVRLTDAELADLAAKGAKQTGAPVRVRAAYRASVTVNPRVGDLALDIGPLERAVWISTGGGRAAMELRGDMIGDAWLQKPGVVNLGRFHRRDGAAQSFEVATSGPHVELEPIRDESFVKKNDVRTDLQIRLEAIPEGGGRLYRVHVSVPPNTLDGEFSGQVFFRVRSGNTQQRFRVPIRGNGSND